MEVEGWTQVTLTVLTPYVISHENSPDSLVCSPEALIAECDGADKVGFPFISHVDFDMMVAFEAVSN